MRVARLLNLHIRYNLYYVSLLQHQTVLYERLTWRIRQRVLSVQDVVLVAEHVGVKECKFTKLVTRLQRARSTPPSASCSMLTLFSVNLTEMSTRTVTPSDILYTGTSTLIGSWVLNQVQHPGMWSDLRCNLRLSIRTPP